MLFTCGPQGLQPSPLGELLLPTGVGGLARSALIGGKAAGRCTQIATEDSRIFSNFEARMWYEARAKAIDISGPPTEALARKVHAARNALKRRTRDMMHDAEEAARLDKNFPLQDFDFYVRKYSAQGLQGEALWRKIIEKAPQPNKAVTDAVKRAAGKQ